MSKMFFKIVFGSLALALGSLPLLAAVPGTKALSGNVPAVVSQLAATSQLPANNQLRLAICLQGRDQDGLDQLMRQIYDPASPSYRKYITPAEFASRFGATESDYQAVKDFAAAHNLTVVEAQPNRLVLDVTGSVADIQSAFSVNLKVYQHPTEARTFYAPTSDPVVPTALPIIQISGLEDYNKPFSFYPRGGSGKNPQSHPNIGSGPGGSYMASEMRNAYLPGNTLTGSGQSVGLFQFDGFFASDITNYIVANGIANPPQVVVVPVAGGVTYPGFGNVEVAMDIEMVMAIAPGVSTIYVYEGSFSASWVDILSRMANDNLAKSLSCSWGSYASQPGALQIFQQMAVQGQTFCTASGDMDAFVNQVNPVPFPTDVPYLTSVGGTVLTTDAGGNYTSEVVWNDGFPRPPGYQGSSGGISPTYNIPSWQQGISMATNHGSTTMRNIPDVAWLSSGIFICYDDGTQDGNGGGTSSASPMWAGLVALINQQSVAGGHSTLGFADPALYSIGQSANYTSCFHDTSISGDNTWPSSPNNFFSVPGYDLCVGLGTPNGTNLINALANPVAVPVYPPPVQPWGNTLSVMNGSNPNGLWFLYYQDDAANYSGTNYSGWSISLTTANPIGYAADNQIYINATNVTVTPSSHWITTLAVTNYGPSISSNVYVVDTLPGAGVTLFTASATLGSVTNYGGSLAWNLGSLAVNAGGTLTLNFLASTAGVYTNSASVAASTTDPNPDDDAVSVVATVGTPPPILHPVLPPGGTGRFLLTITNNPGATIVMQASTNFYNWVPVYTNVSPFTYTNYDVTNFPARFYRAVQMP